MAIFDPYSGRFRSYERQILLFRTIEMALLLFYTEELKKIATSIRATDRLSRNIEEFSKQSTNSNPRLPENLKGGKLLKKALQVLLTEGIIDEEDAVLADAVFDMRNSVAHSIQNLVGDLNQSIDKTLLRDSSYDYSIVPRLMKLLNKIEIGFTSHQYVFMLDFDWVLFSEAESAYKLELNRIAKKLKKLRRERVKEQNLIKSEIASLDKETFESINRRLHLCIHEERLTSVGKESILTLNHKGITPLAISIILHIPIEKIKRVIP